MQHSNLSYSEYEAWCRSRFPAIVDRSESPMATSATELPESGEACPVTVRSVQDRAVVTPRPKGST